MTADDVPTSDRDVPPNLLNFLLSSGLHPADAAELTKRIIDSPWLADRERAAAARAVARVAALADEWDAEQPPKVTWEQGGRKGTIQHTPTEGGNAR